ncbi:DNA-processing protein DprA [Undibacterium fentianense]|uniref:DNA-processing protein DprA n=1 Tax=Undibacterium fentianense TaxID=2828728 RepID=A0A941E5X6_9BURK|nr:DNA-processing protein DprA [Undibacterium fentianense]MBR7800323.1 DNA-processing protein DprA [Undibacterium fentianense]
MHSNSFETDWQDWLRLSLLKGVGNENARRLLTIFGLPSQIFQASRAELLCHFPKKIVEVVLAPVEDALKRQIELTSNWLLQSGNYLLTLGDGAYPQSLLSIPDPPTLLYVKGRLDLLSRPTIAVVGSRNATTQGIQNAENFSESLSRAGFCISSGLAAGIDTAAHYGALRDLGSTIAVIGTGADIVYPARNRQLAHEIAEKGCILSEYPLGVPAIASNFPRRNRIISGLAQGVLVVEAAAQSGSLITARMALEQGRDVFAIPGSIHTPLAKGCHQLIKQGAKLVESAEDILEEMLADFAKPTGATTVSLGLPMEGENELLALIGYDPVHLDVLLARSPYQVMDLNAKLLEFELQGLIELLPGGIVQRLA